jgi:hypoxanthine phosphoribosyltransferase
LGSINGLENDSTHPTRKEKSFRPTRIPRIVIRAEGMSGVDVKVLVRDDFQDTGETSGTVVRVMRTVLQLLDDSPGRQYRYHP